MIKTVMVPKEIDFGFLKIMVPVAMETPDDFPMRRDNTWQATITLDEGEILRWPSGVTGSISVRVFDEGKYDLLDSEFNLVKSIYNCYVPHGLTPCSNNEYLELDIDEFGVIKDWPKNPDISDFFPVMEE